MFYERYLELCHAAGIPPSTAAAKAGFNRGTVSVWKKKYLAGLDVSPNQDVIDKICCFFGCSEQWLRGIPDGTGTVSSLQVERQMGDDDVMVYLWGSGSDMDRVDLAEVKHYAAFLQERKRKK